MWCELQGTITLTAPSLHVFSVIIVIVVDIYLSIPSLGALDTAEHDRVGIEVAHRQTLKCLVSYIALWRTVSRMG